MKKISQLERVLDGIAGASIFVTAQGSHEILYVNERLKNIKHSIQPGDICDEVWKCDHKHCPACSMEEKRAVLLPAMICLLGNSWTSAL